MVVVREWNLLRSYPQPEERIIPLRTIEDRILASYRGRHFFDGERCQGYGGMENDRRWKEVAKDIIKEYHPVSVLQLQSEKGYLLHELKELGCQVSAVDSSSYARKHSMIPTLHNWPDEGNFDLCIALGLVYTLNLSDAMNCLRRIEAVANASFITLAAYETEEDLRLFRKWTLLGTTILRKEEWIEVLKHCGFTGDYWFITAKSLRLREA